MQLLHMTWQGNQFLRIMLKSFPISPLDREEHLSSWSCCQKLVFRHLLLSCQCPTRFNPVATSHLRMRFKNCISFSKSLPSLSMVCSKQGNLFEIAIQCNKGMCKRKVLKGLKNKVSWDAQKISTRTMFEEMNFDSIFGQNNRSEDKHVKFLVFNKSLWKRQLFRYHKVMKFNKNDHFALE